MEIAANMWLKNTKWNNSQSNYCVSEVCTRSHRLVSKEQREYFVLSFLIFFFNDTATTEIYTLSLHDALPIWAPRWSSTTTRSASKCAPRYRRSEEHTSELQSLAYLVCRLLLEKKKTK